MDRRPGLDCGGRGRQRPDVDAALYGVGSRLDENPELLFALRLAEHRESANR